MYSLKDSLINLVIISMLCFLLCGCDAAKSLIPDFGTNQSISKTKNTTVGNGIGEIDSKMKFGEDKSNEFNDSNVTQKNETLTNDNKNDTGNGTKIAGILNDESINHNKSKVITKKNTDDDKIARDQYNTTNNLGINIYQLIIIIIISLLVPSPFKRIYNKIFRWG